MLKKINIKQLEIGLHLLFWGIYLSYPVIKFGNQSCFQFNFEETLINFLFLATVVYLTLYLIFHNPNKKHLAFLLLLYPLSIYWNCNLTLHYCHCNIRPCIINKVAEYLMINAFFIAIVAIKKNMFNLHQLEKIKQEKVQAELKSLKAQLNPHFLFNTLNMLYSNAMEKDEALADKILKLSDNLHYLIHEGEKQTVTLMQEIGFIQDYMSLQKARLGDKVDIRFNQSIDDPNQQIPPMLMIPFIENAFKYSSMIEEEQLPLRIDLFLENGYLELRVENSFDPNYSNNQSLGWKNSGIGIKNVKQRLDLLYPDAHELLIESFGKNFKVNLEIDLL